MLYFHEGLSGMMIYCLPPDGAAAAQPIVAELPDCVEMRPWPPEPGSPAATRA